MSVTLFFGAFAGALLGFAVRNRRYSICKYLFEKHPTAAKSIGWTMLFVMALIPTLVLSNAITLGGTSFFWGGCFVCSLIIGFFITSCLMTDSPQEA
jgi:drug/metabolite transporter superfamily protein YnfA